jgi:uncharacterized membrane protein
MNFRDIQKIHDGGFITGDQRDRIVAHFRLKEESSRFLVVVSFLGAILVGAGIVLLIAAHWEDIPRGVKLAGGLGLMLGAHGAGWWLREGRKDYPRVGEALHFAGSLLFLGNITLVGQIYHLSSRPANALLLWWVGIAALPWLLRSAAQFALFLIAFGVWFGFEINDPASTILFNDQRQVLLYSLLGLAFCGFGLLLRRTSYEGFSPVAERLGLLAAGLFSFPLTWAGFMNWGGGHEEINQWVAPVLAIVAAATALTGALNLTALTSQWRAIWGGTLAIAAVLLLAATYVPVTNDWQWFGNMTPFNIVAAIAIFVFCLIQVQVGVQEGSAFLVNVGLVFLALDVIATYIGLIGSMGKTGVVFVGSGVFLILLAVFLERKRRGLMSQIRATTMARGVQP